MYKRQEPLSGYERLKVLHDVFNMDTNEPFRFSFDMVARTGLSAKDFIAPTSFDFREGKCFKMGGTDVYKRQGYHPVHSSLDFLNRMLAAPVDKRSHIKLLTRMLQMCIRDSLL